MEFRRYIQTHPPFRSLSFLITLYPSMFIILSVIVESSLVSLKENMSNNLFDILKFISSNRFGKRTMFRNAISKPRCFGRQLILLDKSLLMLVFRSGKLSSTVETFWQCWSGMINMLSSSLGDPLIACFDEKNDYLEYSSFQISPIVGRNIVGPLLV